VGEAAGPGDGEHHPGGGSQQRGVDVADAQVPDQAVGAQLRQCGEPLGDLLASGCVPPVDPQVDQVEMVGAELSQVVLDQPASPARRGPH
jgi:hypothetical protein